MRGIKLENLSLSSLHPIKKIEVSFWLNDTIILQKKSNSVDIVARSEQLDLFMHIVPT